jgi:two-component system cell cycle response regulator
MPSNTERKADEKELLINKLHDCLTGNVGSQDLSVDWLARHLHMSRPTLFRKMKRITGFTPNELINETRLNRAAVLLATGSYRASQVARMVGYTSQSSFGKSFLKQFKVTPAHYQRMKKIMDVA